MAHETITAEQQEHEAQAAQIKRRLDPCALALRALRRAYQETQENFAHRIGVTVSTMNRWENGLARPSPLAQRILDDLEARRPPTP